MATRNKIPTDDLIEEMQIAAMALGRQPRMDEMREFGEYSAQVYLNRFGSWPEAVEAAGIEYEDPLKAIDPNDIIDDVGRVKEKLGKRPSSLDYERHGEYSLNVVKRHIGKWHEVLREVEDFE